MKQLTRWQKIKYTYDWGTIFKTAGFFVFGFLLFYFIFNRSYFEMKWDGGSKKGTTTGYIVNRVEHTDLRQSQTHGNEFYTDAINLYFSYKVNGTTYFNHESVRYSVVIAQSLNKARRNPLPYPVTIRYDEHDPQQSIIWFNRN